MQIRTLQHTLDYDGGPDPTLLLLMRRRPLSPMTPIVVDKTALVALAGKRVERRSPQVPQLATLVEERVRKQKRSRRRRRAALRAVVLLLVAAGAFVAGGFFRAPIARAAVSLLHR